MKKLAKEIIEQLKKSSKGIILISSESLFKSGEYLELIKFFKDQLVDARQETIKSLGGNEQIIRRIENWK